MRNVLKWVGIILGGLVVLIVLAALVLYVRGGQTLGQKFNTPTESFAIPTSAEAVARGQYLMSSTTACAECHGANLGGVEFINDGMIGQLWTPNLTAGQGGVGASYTDADWERSIRHGVRPSGQALFIMPSHHFTHMSDEDLGAVLAYLKTFPPVDQAIPPRRIAPVGQIMAGAGMFGQLPAAQIDQTAPHVAAMARDTSAAYGAYLVELATCADCHGPKLDGQGAGGPGGGTPPANLTPAGDLANWTEADFRNAIHTGVTPDGRTLSPEMPWQFYGKMEDQDLAAIFAYLKSLPPSGQ
jgi:mono/diheme cytochrome c family protein